jgi:hypothetical protein
VQLRSTNSRAQSGWLVASSETQQEDYLKEEHLAVGEQLFGFFIPTVTLMGVGAHKEIG